MSKGKVRTVLGDIDPKEMGYTLSHEHILTNPQGMGSKVEDDHTLNSLEKAIEMCKIFKAAGGGTLIDRMLQERVLMKLRKVLSMMLQLVWMGLL